MAALKLWLFALILILVRFLKYCFKFPLHDFYFVLILIRMSLIRVFTGSTSVTPKVTNRHGNWALVYNRKNLMVITWKWNYWNSITIQRNIEVKHYSFFQAQLLFNSFSLGSDWYCNTFELNAKGYAELMDIKDVKGVHALESKAKLLSQAFTQDAVFRYREKGKIEEVKCAMRIASALTGYGKGH